MGPITLLSLSGELKKLAEGAPNVPRHLLELAGLGTLMSPSIQEYRGKKVNEKNKALAEIAGLGMLAGPYVKDLAAEGLKRIRKNPSTIAKAAAAWTPDMKAMALNDAYKAHQTAKPQVGPPGTNTLHSARMGTGRADMLSSFTPAGKFTQPATLKPVSAAKPLKAAPRVAPLGKVTSQAAGSAAKKIGVLGKALSIFRG